MTRTAVPASRLVPGDRVMGWPMSPMYVRKRPTPAYRNGAQVGWNVALVGIDTMTTMGDPELDVIMAPAPADGEMR